MEFYVQKSDLLKELELAQGAVEKKGTVPILSHVLLEAADLNLRISATDLELGARSNCPAKVKTAGVATVPARRVLEIVRSLPDSEVRFKLLENHWVRVTCERSTFKLVGLAKENFPALPAVPKVKAELPASVLAGLLEKTRFAVSDEESRFTLNGALLSLNAGSVKMVATDGHRLALAEQEHATAGLTSGVSLLIPKRALGELRRVLGEAVEDATVQIASDEKHIFFTVEDRLLISRMVTGTYPNYETERITESSNWILTRSGRRFGVWRCWRASSRRPYACCSRRTGWKSPPQAASTERRWRSWTARNDHEPLRIGFNYKFLVDFFDVLGKGGRIRMTLKDDQSAVEFRPIEEHNGCRHLYVVMPLRL